MSSGEFIIGRYESNELGAIMPVRVQPETLLLFIGGTVNAVATGTVNLGLFAQVSKNKKSYGVGCRTVSIRWVGTAPDGYKAGEALTIPVMTLAAYTVYTPGTTGSYLGNQVVVIGRSADTAR